MSEREICAHPGIDSVFIQKISSLKRFFHAGDKIKFDYSGEFHNVIELTKEKYDDCEV